MDKHGADEHSMHMQCSAAEVTEVVDESMPGFSEDTVSMALSSTADSAYAADDLEANILKRDFASPGKGWQAQGKGGPTPSNGIDGLPSSAHRQAAREE